MRKGAELEEGSRKVLIAAAIAITVVVASVAVVMLLPGRGNLPPCAVVDSPEDMSSFPVGQEITFSAASSSDPDGEIVSYAWDFGDGNSTETGEPQVQHSYASPGLYKVTLTVTDDDGATNSTYVRVIILSQQEHTATVAELWSDPESLSGMVVKLEGVVFVEGLSWSFSVADSGDYRTFKVYVEKGADAPSEISKGDILEIRGLVTYYSGGGFWEVKVRNSTSDYVRIVGHGGETSYARVPLGEIDQYRWCLVDVREVEVTDVKASFLFTVSSEGKDVAVYVEWGATRPATISKGDVVNVTGLYTYYSKGGYWEIKVRNSSADAVVLVRAAGYREATISELLSSPEEYDGSSVVVRNATVVEVLRRNQEGVPWLFKVAQGNDSIMVYSEKGGNVPAELKEGDLVDVWALFTYYQNGSYWELKVRAGTQDRVEIVEHGVVEYVRVGVHQLLQDPESYNGTNVAVLNVTVVEVLRRNEEGVPWLFTVGSEEENVTVYAEVGANVSPEVDVGVLVDVYGYFTYYAPGDYYEIKIRAGTEDRVYPTAPSGYNRTSVGEILGDPEAYIGSCVQVDGAFVYGKPYLFYLADEGGNRTIKVYVEPGGTRPQDIGKGDGVRVEGVVSEYEGEIEILVRNGTSDSVRLLGRTMETSYLPVPFVDLSSSPDAYNHTLLSTGGLQVLEKEAPYKYVVGNLTVSEWTMVLYYERDSGAPELEVGQPIEEVRGFFTYYSSGGYFEIVIRNSSSDRVVPQGAQRYAFHSLPDLVKNRTVLKGSLVKTRGYVTGYKNSSYGTLSYFYLSNVSTGYTLKVYVGKLQVQCNVSFGDLVEVWGLLTEFWGELEISVRPDTGDSYAVVGHAEIELQYAHLTLSELLGNRESYLYTLVSLDGLTVEEVHSSYIIASSGGQTIEIYFEAGTPSWISSGDQISVRGHFKPYDTGDGLIYEVAVRSNSPDAAWQGVAPPWPRGIALSAEDM